MTYQLICEGACNGHTAVQVLDGQIRNLKYTPHEMADTQAQCVVCGHRRVYGLRDARGDHGARPLGEAFDVLA